MRHFSVNPKEMAATLWRNHTLVSMLIRRDMLARYRGSLLGVLWTLLTPLFMLSIYTFVFSVVLNARWGNEDGGQSEFALILFAGLIIFNFFAECFTIAPTLIHTNVNYVKKVVFPLEVLPWISVGVAFFHALVSFAVWMLAYCLLCGWPQSTVVYFPLIMFPFVFFVLGVSWATAALGVYIRDLGQVVSLLISVLMFLSPIFYPVDALPLTYQKYLLWNPLMPVIQQTRSVLYWGTLPDWELLAAYYLASFLVAWSGFGLFQKMRRGFSDVI